MQKQNGITPKDIVIACPGLPFNGKTFDNISLGGSESACYYLARALARLGHRVQVFCNTEAVRCDDVDYLPLGLFQQYVSFTTHDVCIVQRTPELLSGHVRSRFTAVWCHDLALGRSESKVRGTSWNYDKLFVLSDFMRTQYQQVYGLPEELVYQTRNGVDLDTVERVRMRIAGKAKRNPLSLVFSARPERGLDILLGEIMPRILEHEPAARLFISSYHNPVDHLQEFYSHCDALAARLGDRVVKLGSLNKEQLYEVYQTAGLYLYPTPSKIAADFDEVSCLSLMEAQACGLPIVTSARGALPETMAPGAGVLISDEIHTEQYYKAFAHAALRLMRTPEEWQAASAAGLARAQELGWDEVARNWSALFESEIRKNSANLATMANHFWRHSDIYAARECLKQLPADDAASRYVRDQIAQNYTFVDEPDGFRKQYERIGGTHDAAVINWAPQEPRYIAMRDWLNATSGEICTVLDYGCAHGAYAVNLLKELPHLSITGVDIDSHGIEMGYTFAEKLGVKERWRGVVGDYARLSDVNVPEMAEAYDCAVAQEVLEHVPNPPAVLRALETRVRDGGWVYITVPFGPWEYTDYNRYPYRAHVWEFDIQDLHDLLDVKGPEAEVAMHAMPFNQSPETAEPLGWWVVRYRVTPATRGLVGEIDLERKLWLQRPRQTVSASLIAGPNCEETLLWTLRSLTHVADEVVIVDCGMSPLARQLAEAELKSKLVLVDNGPDPKTQGFETPRNVGLARCTQDWILWIDTDEKLLQPEALNKYLRRNIFNGYSIRQHHFAVDTTFDPDLPVRLFRNNGVCRFWGMVHEHPETSLNAGPGRTIVLPDVHIAHVGYLLESGRKQRFVRNYPMLEADKKRYPDRLLQKHFIMRDNILLCTYELQRTGGRVSEQMRARAQETIDLWREHFRGKGFFTNSDPIQYYSQAVSLLGGGTEVAFQVSADKISAKVNGATKVRFANMEDALIEITHRTRSAVAPFENRYW